MSAPAKHLRWTGRLFLVLALGSSLVVGTVALLPKDSAFGSNERLAMTTIVLAAALVGIFGVAASVRHYRDLALASRYPRATRAMRDTIAFLRHERALGRRYRLAILIGFLVAAELALLSYWPQWEVLAPFRGAFKFLAAILGLLLILQPIFARRHLVNALYLRRYLGQQAEHLGIGSATRKRAASIPPAPALGEFCAGGFAWRFDDFTKNFLVFGQPGSGKTICVLNAVLDGLLRAPAAELKIGGVILDPKGVYLEVVERLCQKLGRSDDLHILSLDNWAKEPRTRRAIAFNPSDTDEDSLEFAARLITAQKLVGGVEARDSFFLDASRVFCRHAITLLREAAAPQPTSLLDLHSLCAEPVDSATVYEQLIETLQQKYPDNPPPAVETAVAYFENEWRTLPDRQRAGVRSSVNQLLDDFTTDPIRDIISGHSTISIAEVIDTGKILYVHLPLAARERVARVFTGLIKLEFQREVLRRPGKERPTFLLADEFQTLFTAGEEHGDSDFFERSRESRHANIVAAQNMSSFLKRTRNKHDVTNFLGLCAVKVFLRNSERETNEWASNLFGERSEIIVTASESASLDGGFSRHRTSYSRSTKTVRVVPPEAFATLAVPVAGRRGGRIAESVIHLGSREAVTKLELNWPVHGVNLMPKRFPMLLVLVAVAVGTTAFLADATTIVLRPILPWFEWMLP